MDISLKSITRALGSSYVGGIVVSLFVFIVGAAGLGGGVAGFDVLWGILGVTAVFGLLLLLPVMNKVWWQQGIVIAILAFVIHVFLLPLLLGGGDGDAAADGGGALGLVIQVAEFLVWGLASAWVFHQVND